MPSPANRPDPPNAADVAPRRERSRDHPVVRAAVANVAANIDALSASEIVQLVLWPESLAAWAKRAGEDESQLSNMFRRHRTYSRLRQRLAERLDVPLPVLEHLVEATPRAAASRRAPGQEEVLAAAGLAPFTARPPIDWGSPPYPRYREGTNPLERLALNRLTAEVLSMPTSRVVAYALWPDTLAAWSARSHRFSLAQLLTSLSGVRRYHYVEAALARRLGLSMRELDEFIRAAKPEPASSRPAAGALDAAVPRREIEAPHSGHAQRDLDL